MGRKRNIEPIMKPLAMAALVAFGAVSLFAGDQTTTQAPAAQAPAAQPPAPQLQPPDSPLVRAAKASSRAASSKKKKIVITNETLAKGGGHITTTTPAAQQPLPPPPRIDPALDKLAAEQKKQRDAEYAARAKAEKEEVEKKKNAAARANAIYEGDDPEGIYEDPATSEGRMQKQSPPQPQQTPTMQVQKPPM